MHYSLTGIYFHETGDDGLRTLLYSSKDVSESEYEAWATEWEAALLDPDEDRQAAKCEKLAPMMEEGHKPVGASAIEDKLQENVGETISHLAEAGIQTWVLTGDKTNTAIMIGYACCLLKTSMEVFIVKQDRGADEAAAGDRVMQVIEQANQYFGDGTKLCPASKQVVTCENWCVGPSLYP